MDIPTIEQNLIEHLDLPKNLGKIDLPLDPLYAGFNQLFGVENTKFTIGTESLIPQDKLPTFFEENLYHVAMSSPQISGKFYLLIAKSEINKLSHLLLQNKSSEITNSDFLEALFVYVTAHLLGQFQKNQLPNTTFQIEDAIAMPKTPLVDIPVTIDSHGIAFHIAMTPEFQRGFVEKHSTKDKGIPKELRSSLQVALGMQVGSTLLDYEQVQDLEVGDFMMLDRCTYDPQTHLGNISFMLGNRDICRGKIKEGQIKILNMPFEMIGENDMDIPPFERDENNPMEPDLSLPEQEMPLPPTPSAETTEGSVPPSEEPWVEPKAGETTEKGGVKAEPATPSSVEPSSIKAKDIPIQISVEIGRIQMNVEKFLDLKPDQVLNLDVQSKKEVDLIVEGKRLAKGELVKVQDLLGVRITKID